MANAYLVKVVPPRDHEDAMWLRDNLIETGLGLWTDICGCNLPPGSASAECDATVCVLHAALSGKSCLAGFEVDGERR